MSSHFWSLQEAVGTVIADSIESNSGTIDDSVTLGVAGPGGEYPNAAEFSGGSATPIILDSAVTLSRKHAWSIKFWAKQDGVNQEGMILGDRNSPLSFVWLSSSFGGLVVRPTNAVTLTGANSGLDIVFAVPNATRTKWSKYELSHDVSGSTPELTLHVDDVLIATETVTHGMELIINTIGGGHTSSTFSMDGQISGVEVSGTEFDHAKPDKVVLILGQSNAEGRFDNNQVYDHPTQFASVFENGEWNELFDTGTDGEVWPLLASRWLEARDESVGFIYAAVGATGLVDAPDWGAGGATYDAAIATVQAANVNRIDAILWFQGERDANLSVSRADYAAAMDDLVARLHNDLPNKPPLLCGQINSVLSGTSDEIRNAQSDSWANEHIFAGPVTYDIGPLADDLHFTTDAEAITLADRWWAAIDEALFEGTEGVPPGVVSAVIDGSTMTLTLDRDLEAVGTYDVQAWAFTDNGSDISVLTATQAGVRTVELGLASIPTSSKKILTLGAGTSAQGLDVPRGLGEQPVLPKTYPLTVPVQHAETSSSIRGMLRVTEKRRTISLTRNQS